MEPKHRFVSGQLWQTAPATASGTHQRSKEGIPPNLEVVYPTCSPVPAALCPVLRATLPDPLVSAPLSIVVSSTHILNPRRLGTVLSLVPAQCIAAYSKL